MRSTPSAVESSEVGIKLGLAQTIASRVQGARRVSDGLEKGLSGGVIFDRASETGVAKDELVNEHDVGQGRVSGPCEEVIGIQGGGRGNNDTRAGTFNQA